jgi:hypothetical protein
MTFYQIRILPYYGSYSREHIYYLTELNTLVMQLFVVLDALTDSVIKSIYLLLIDIGPVRLLARLWVEALHFLGNLPFRDKIS